MSKIAWGAWIQLGLGELRLTPEVFWSLTPTELMLMAGQSGHGGQVLNRTSLDALMAQFPDLEEEQ